jgi:hypothetical protein
MNVKARLVYTAIPIILPWRKAGDRQITRIALDGALQKEQLEGCHVSVGASMLGPSLFITHGDEVVVVPLSLCYVIGDIGRIV